MVSGAHSCLIKGMWKCKDLIREHKPDPGSETFCTRVAQKLFRAFFDQRKAVCT